METDTNLLARLVHDLVGPSSGMLHLRLVIQPVVAIWLALRASVDDGREWRRARRVETREMEGSIEHSVWKEVSTILLAGVLLDAMYQYMALPSFHYLQAVFVAVTCSALPYVLIRGLVTRLVADATGSHPAAPSRTRPSVNSPEA